MKHFVACGLLAASLALAACQKEDRGLPATPAAGDGGSAAAPTGSVPDFGGVQGVAVEAEGIGPTANIAALRALDMAIAQVNGRRVDSATAGLQAGINVDVAGLGSTAVDSDAYADLVVSSSRGAVRSFSILSSEEIERLDAERSVSASLQTGGWLGGDSLVVQETEKRTSRYWKVRVKAEVAKFVGPTDDGRPSITIAAPRTDADHYPVGDGNVDAAGVAAEIRGRLSDVLTRTGRFQVLDREFGDELQAEVDFINSGNARSEEVARLGQRLATDLILVPTIEHFAYPRSVRQLRMSDRQLVSYAGGGRITLRLINATTGEVVMSESFTHELPATSASTLPRSVDGAALAGQLMDSLSGAMAKAVVNGIFPISVIAVNGDNVVLSQGGKSVAVGERYDAVLLGDELKDPQTGRSLGRMETPCCIVHVERVAEKTAYGRIESEKPPKLAGFRPGMIELRGLVRADEAQASSSTSAETPHSEPVRSPTPARTARAKPAASTVPVNEDENW